MNKNLKRVLVTGAALLMFASVGAGTNGNANASHNVGWRQVTRATNLNVKRGKRIHLRKNQRVYVIKLNKKSAKIKIGRKYYNLKTSLLKKSPRAKKAIKKYKKAKQRKQTVKRLINQANKKTRTHRNRRRSHKKNVRVLKAHFRRSNNKKLLAKSGFINYMNFQVPGTNKFIHGGPDITNKYAPNSRRAVIPKNINIKKMVWLKGVPFQSNPVEYTYNKKAHGWIQL